MVAAIGALQPSQVAVTRWLGSSVVHEDEPENKLQVARSILVGFVIIVITYMVPLVGIVAWLTIGVLGLGAATASLFKALRRENPSAPKAPRKGAAPVAAGPSAGAGGMVRDVPVEGASTVYGAEAGGMPAGATPAFATAAGYPPSEAAPAPGYAPAYAGAAAAAAPVAGGFDLLAMPRATFWRRVAAAFLDFVLVMIVFQMMDLRGRRDEFWFCALLVAYLATLWTWRGTTIGGIIAHLRVVRTDGFALSGVDSLIRAVSSLFSAFMLGIGFLWILKDQDRQGWHDKIAGTYVVVVPRSAPLR